MTKKLIKAYVTSEDYATITAAAARYGISVSSMAQMLIKDGIRVSGIGK